jgi:hypothetical protein
MQRNGDQHSGSPRPMQRLTETLRRIDGRGYGAYKDIRGAYQLHDWTLCIDHVQGDQDCRKESWLCHLCLQVEVRF